MEDFTHPHPDLVFCGKCYAFHRKAETRMEYLWGTLVCAKKSFKDIEEEERNTRESLPNR